MKDSWHAGFDPEGCRDVDLSQTGYRQTGTSTLCQVHGTQGHVHC